MTEQGKKYDANKPRWDLLPLDALEGAADILTFGAKKYSDHNWRLVENAEDLSHQEKVDLQQEIIKRQEEQKLRQEREYLHLKKQEHYNNLQRRFEDQEDDMGGLR